MFGFIKRLFIKENIKNNNSNMDEKSYIDENSLNEKYDILLNNICMIKHFLNLTNSDCSAIEAILKLTAEGLVSAVYDNETIIRNNLILRLIYYRQPSFKLAEDLSSYKMSFNEFIERITDYSVEFTYQEDETDKYTELNSEIMVKKIDKASNLMLKRYNEELPFTIFVKPAAAELDNSNFYDSTAKTVALDIANKVVRESETQMAAILINRLLEEDHIKIIQMLNNEVFIPIFNYRIINADILRLTNSFRYYIVFDEYRNKIKKEIFTHYNIICEKEDIQVIAERKLKRFKGYKYIDELFNDPKYPNNYFKNNVNVTCIEQMKYLFLNKMVKTKEEIITAFVDFIPTQFALSLDEPISFKGSNKKKNNENKKNKNNKNNKNEIDLTNFYKYEYSNADIKLSDLTKSLENNKDAKILFYGVSGSGKSLFAKKLGEKLGMEVKIVKASDILRSFVGESEQAIKNVFENLDPSNQILVFDEIDSFITERSGTKNSWEITQANEMLVQLENYKGIFIGTTNLIDNIDKAFFRRFDIKVKFDYMKKDESVNLLKDYMKAMKFKINNNNIDKIKKLNVTPAMFSVVYRRSKFEPIKNTDEYISKLEKESKHINGNSSNIGFL